MLLAPFFRLLGDGFKCFGRPSRSMEPKAKAMFILCLLVASVLPISVNGEDSGGVQASEFTMSLTPQNPVMGGSVDIDVVLYNLSLIHI